jgi:hypothetical protein
MMSMMIRILTLSISIVVGLCPALARGQPESISQQQQFALREGGIRAAVKVTGHYVGSAQFHDVVAMGLDTLVHDSTAVIVGTIEDNRCRLSADGAVITTDYTVTVLESLKGAPVVGTTVTVSIPGGRVEFEDGTWAELVAEDFTLPQRGERYIMFLRPSRYHPTLDAQKLAGPIGVLSPSFGAQGVFYVTPDSSRVYPRGRRVDLVVKKYWGTDYAAFMLDLHAAATPQW